MREAQPWLYDLAKTAPFQVKTTEATHYRRLAIRDAGRGQPDAEIFRHSVGRGFGIRDGNGIVFINHDGDRESRPASCPSRRQRPHDDSIVDLYRDHEVLRGLRNPTSFKGRCGACQYARVCGGSRARAYAWTGDPLEADPLCPYVPSGTAPQYGMA